MWQELTILEDELKARRLMDAMGLNAILIELEYDRRYYEFTEGRMKPVVAPNLDHLLVKEVFESHGIQFEHDKKQKMLHHFERYDQYGMGLSIHLEQCNVGHVLPMLHVLQHSPEHGELVATNNGVPAGAFFGMLALGTLMVRNGLKEVPKSRGFGFYFSTEAEFRDIIKFLIGLYSEIREPTLAALKKEYESPQAKGAHTQTVEEAKESK